MFDLVFEKKFELSHGWKNGSVYFIGYTAEDPSTDEIDSGDDDFSDKENVLDALSEKLEADVKPDTKKSALVKDEKNAKVVAEPKKEAESHKDDDDSEDDSDDEDDREDDSSDGPVSLDSDGPEGMDFSEDDDSAEDETPKKVEQKKRSAPCPKVASGSGKKAKQATPQNKSANGNNKQKTRSPRFGGQFSGHKSNNKNFSGQKNFKGKQGRK